MAESKAGRDRGMVMAAIFSLFAFAYLCFWIIHLFPTLINDEYSALDFVWRALKTGEFAPPPHRFYKPYSLLMGILALKTGPLLLELLAALFASGLVMVFYLCLRERLGKNFALLSTLMLIFAVDLFDNTLQAITIVPGTFFIFAALAAGMKLPEKPEQWKNYSLLAFLGGLARPEPWLLAFPLLAWLFPQNRRQLARWVLAPAVIALSAAVWFGKDWFLNQDIFYSLKVARYDKMIGTGASFGLGMSLYWFHHYLSQRFSTFFEVICLLGLGLYIWKHRKRWWREPILMTTLLLFLFLYLSIWRGLYPQMRFFFPLGVCLLFFAGFFLEQLFAFCKRGRVLGYALVLLIVAEYFAWSGYRLATVEYRWLRRESELQKQVMQLADYFRPLLADRSHRILLSDRRDDQFSWLLRDLPLQDYIHYREAYYYQRFQGRDFLSFEPQWIIWLPNDFQFRGVQEMFEWLSYQDRTELSGYSIELQKTIADFRIFAVKKIQP
jgi:hypothetical protein